MSKIKQSFPTCQGHETGISPSQPPCIRSSHPATVLCQTAEARAAGTSHLPEGLCDSHGRAGSSTHSHSCAGHAGPGLTPSLHPVSPGCCPCRCLQRAHFPRCLTSMTSADAWGPCPRACLCAHSAPVVLELGPWGCGGAAPRPWDKEARRVGGRGRGGRASCAENVNARIKTITQAKP